MMRVRALRESPIGPLSRPTRRLPVRFWWLVLGFVLGVLLTGVAQAMPPQLFKPEWFLPLERLAPATAQRTVLPSAPVDVSGVRYVRDGREWRLDDFLKRGQVKSLLVVHDGQIVHETHQWPYGPGTRHQSWSVMKQVLSMLVGRALQRGQIRSLDDPMDRYLPSLAQNGFAGVTFRQGLLMSSGVRYVEDVDRIRLFQSTIYRRLSGGLVGQSLAQQVASPSLDRVYQPGSRYEYASIVSQALGMALEAASGQSVLALLQRDVWQALGVPDEGRLLVDADGQSLALCCLYATPRTYALLGQWALQDGVWQGQRLLPEGWMAQSASFANPLAWRSTQVPRPAKTQELFGFGYHWWPLEGGRGDYTALGIHGQMVYVSPRDRLVVVRLSEDYEEGAHNEEAIAAFRALAAHLNKSAPH